MRATTDRFMINGKPMLIPDTEVGMHYADMDSDTSGRDESGFLHRRVTRYRVPTWSFSYAHLTEEERQYMEGLFPDTPSFEFTHPSRLNADETEVTTCYRSEYGITWQNAKTGLWRSFSFDIIAC